VWRIDYFSLCGSFPFFSEQEIRTVAYSRTGSRHFYRKKFTLPLVNDPLIFQVILGYGLLSLYLVVSVLILKATILNNTDDINIFMVFHGALPVLAIGLATLFCFRYDSIINNKVKRNGLVLSYLLPRYWLAKLVVLGVIDTWYWSVNHVSTLSIWSKPFGGLTIIICEFFFILFAIKITKDFG
jgi:hypothetical protein